MSLSLSSPHVVGPLTSLPRTSLGTPTAPTPLAPATLSPSPCRPAFSPAASMSLSSLHVSSLSPSAPAPASTSSREGTAAAHVRPRAHRQLPRGAAPSCTGTGSPHTPSVRGGGGRGRGGSGAAAAFDSATASKSSTPAETESSSPLEDTDGTDGSATELMQWMFRNGFPTDSKVTLREKAALCDGDKSIHYVAAKEDLQPGDVALFVPSSLIVTLERVLGDETIAELVTTNKLSELACLALYLMYEKKRGPDSFWLPFIQELDRQRGRGQSAVETPLLWEPQEVEEYLQGSPMQAVVEERVSGMRREYGELDAVWFLAGSLFKEYPFDIPSEAFSFEIFKQAFVAVQACIVHLQGVSIARRFALVPLGPPLLSYKSTSRAMLAAVEGGVALKVDKPVKAGDPITVWCGPQPNTRLLLNYGFVDEDNPYDKLFVTAALDPKDPLYQSKRAIVQRNDKLTIQTFQLVRGKEREMVNDMLPYLRLGHVTDPLEMETISFAEGPVCGVNAESELPVLRQLEAYFKGRLARYPTTMEQDKELLKTGSASPRKLVATRLVLIEKEILTNALDTVQETIASLPQSGGDASCQGTLYPPTLS